MDADLLSLRPLAAPNRRGFLTTTLIAGFTVAAGPVQAQTAISTPATGLTAGEVEIPVAGGKLPAYRAMPASGGPFPVVLVVQEIFGVHEYIKDTCRRFAKEGYMAIAPELYARHADVKALNSMDAARAAMGKVPDQEVMADLDSAVAWAKSTGSGNTDKLAITGFCWGGRIVWLYTAHNPNVDAGVAWYGRLEGTPSPINPTHPIDQVAKMRGAVLGLYGEADAGIPMASVEKMRAALKAAGKADEIVTYKDAPHAFHADYRPSYRKEPAEDGWKRALAWFKKHGVA
ncbi:dienelactone hydrolase family protein [Desertibaculum subflavum]|uniref:dienelactone hydrolase family protein n=1 Tax=Desertibaculum subflavum TaxID=2268458 RepID=UPI000E6619AE